MYLYVYSLAVRVYCDCERHIIGQTETSSIGRNVVVVVVVVIAHLKFYIPLIFLISPIFPTRRRYYEYKTNSILISIITARFSHSKDDSKSLVRVPTQNLLPTSSRKGTRFFEPAYSYSVDGVGRCSNFFSYRATRTYTR